MTLTEIWAATQPALREYGFAVSAETLTKEQRIGLVLYYAILENAVGLVQQLLNATFNDKPVFVPLFVDFPNVCLRFSNQQKSSTARSLETPFSLAVRKQRPEIVELFLSWLLDGKYDLEPAYLMFLNSCRYGNLPAIETFLRVKPDLIPAKTLLDALYRSAAEGRTETVCLLFTHAANHCHEPDFQEFSVSQTVEAAVFAMTNNHLETMRYLFEDAPVFETDPRIELSDSWYSKSLAQTLAAGHLEALAFLFRFFSIDSEVLDALRSACEYAFDIESLRGIAAVLHGLEIPADTSEHPLELQNQLRGYVKCENLEFFVRLLRIAPDLARDRQMQLLCDPYCKAMVLSGLFVCEEDLLQLRTHPSLSRRFVRL